MDTIGLSKVVLLTVDSLRADAIGAYDNERYTPVMDSIANSGTAFERAFATGNWTHFSFPSIMASRPVFVDVGRLNYLVGAVIAIEITIALSYVLNNAWTFRRSRNTGRDEYLSGLLKTNVVRGTAIPIQVAVLFALVEWASIPYLIGNGGGIAVSGIYRYVLDARWTWGNK